MENALISAAVESLAISIKPKEGIAIKTMAAYGQVVNVVMAVPLAVTLGGPPTISEAPAPQLNFQSQSFQEMNRGLDQQIGRDAVEKAVTTGMMPPFVNTIDGNERWRYHPNASAYYSSQGETGTPLPLRMLSLIR
jgi:hypothetical protein